MNKFLLVVLFVVVGCCNIVRTSSYNRESLHSDVIPEGSLITDKWSNPEYEGTRFFSTDDTIKIDKPIFLQIGRTYYILSEKTANSINFGYINDIRAIENNPNIYKLTYYPIHWMPVIKKDASKYLCTNNKPLETLFHSHLLLSNGIDYINTNVEALEVIICFQNYSYYKNLHYYFEGDCHHSGMCPFRNDCLNEYNIFERVVYPLGYQ